MNAGKSVANTIRIASLALVLSVGSAFAAHGPHDDVIKSPFDGLGGVGGVNTARHDLQVLAGGGNQSSPFDSLGGIGGRGTAHAPATIVGTHDPDVRSPFESLGGIGGRGTARSIAPLLVMGQDGRSPFDSLGGIGGRNTAHAPAPAA